MMHVVRTLLLVRRKNALYTVCIISPDTDLDLVCDAADGNIITCVEYQREHTITEGYIAGKIQAPTTFSMPPLQTEPTQTHHSYQDPQHHGSMSSFVISAKPVLFWSRKPPQPRKTNSKMSAGNRICVWRFGPIILESQGSWRGR